MGSFVTFYHCAVCAAVDRPLEVDVGMGEGLQQRRPRVLVVEDNPLLARFTAMLLAEFGCDVVGPVGCVDTAVALVASEPLDAALLDLNVADRWAAPVAEALDRRGTPFAIMTGYGRENLPPAFHGRSCLYKPFRASDLKSVMAALLGPG
jgi:DNA-binding response OmpR family regulator